MASRDEAALPIVYVRSMGLRACAEPCWIRTVVGSCVAVCLHDPGSGIGGMNHFLLPECPPGGRPDPLRYGREAIPRLIEALLDLGAVRGKLVARLVGGAHMLEAEGPPVAISQRNILVAREELAREFMPVVGEMVGGHRGRHVCFRSDTGELRVELTTGRDPGR